MRQYHSPDAQVPLTEDDRECLLHIHWSRLKTFRGAFATLGLIALLFSHPWTLKRDDYYPVYKHGSGRYGGGSMTWVEVSPISNNGAVCLMLLFWLVVLGVPAAFVYRKRVLPLRRDAEGGFKMVLYHTVTGKQYFNHIGQYFLLLDNPDCMNQEVDAETYYQAQPGDGWPMFFAPRSGFAFNPRGRFSPI